MDVNLTEVSKYDRLLWSPGKEELSKLGFKLETELEWFEEDTLGFLITYFQTGYFVFINEIFDKIEIDIDNIPARTKDEFFQLSFLKFISQQITEFRKFLYNWVRKIKITSVDNPIVLNNQIDGKILWKDTFRERNYLAYPQSIKFVCTSYKTNFDSLENIMLKSFLNFLKNIVESHLNYLEVEKEKKKEDWRFHAINIYNLLKKILTNYYMREITLKKNKWKNKYLLNRALKSCHKNNLLILLFANLYNDLRSSNNRDLLERFLMNYIIKPNEDKTAELFVLFTIIQKISSQKDGYEEYLLIKLRKDSLNQISQPVYTKIYEDNIKIKIYYQITPSWISIKYPDVSLISKTLEYYNLKIVELHPDITIEVSNGHKKKIILIEVKNSKKSDYIRQGLTQLCNYYEFLKITDDIGIENTSDFKKEGILISKGIPNEWKIDVDNIWNNDQIKIKYLDFHKLKSLNNRIFVSKLLQIS